MPLSLVIHFTQLTGAAVDPAAGLLALLGLLLQEYCWSPTPVAGINHSCSPLLYTTHWLKIQALKMDANAGYSQRQSPGSSWSAIKEVTICHFLLLCV